MWSRQNGPIWPDNGSKGCTPSTLEVLEDYDKNVHKRILLREKGAKVPVTLEVKGIQRSSKPRRRGVFYTIEQIIITFGPGVRWVPLQDHKGMAEGCAVLLSEKDSIVPQTSNFYLDFCIKFHLWKLQNGISRQWSWWPFGNMEFMLIRGGWYTKFNIDMLIKEINNNDMMFNYLWEPGLYP